MSEVVELSAPFAKGLYFYLDQAAHSLDRAGLSLNLELRRVDVVDESRRLRAFYEGSGTPLPSQVAKAITPEAHPPIDLTIPDWAYGDEIPRLLFRRRQFLRYYFRGVIHIENVCWNFVRNVLNDYSDLVEGTLEWIPETKGPIRIHLSRSANLIAGCLPRWGWGRAHRIEYFNQAYQFDGVRKPLPEVAPPNWLEHGPGSV